MQKIDKELLPLEKNLDLIKKKNLDLLKENIQKKNKVQFLESQLLELESKLNNY